MQENEHRGDLLFDRTANATILRNATILPAYAPRPSGDDPVGPFWGSLSQVLIEIVIAVI